MIRRVNEVLLSTLAACGDVERNVLTCPAPIRDGIRDAMQHDADAFVSPLRPQGVELLRRLARRREGRRPEFSQSRADPRSLRLGDDPVEPIYGKAYLPRKFKTAFALPEDNCTDVYRQ